MTARVLVKRSSTLWMDSVLTPKADGESHSYHHLQVGMSDRFTGTKGDKGTQLQHSSPQSGCT